MLARRHFTFVQRQLRLPQNEMRRDIVSLQVGTTANYVGAHFWNLQDEYFAVPPAERELSPETFFREVGSQSRAGRSGLRYAPRLQVIDATGSFGALCTNSGAVLADREEAASKEFPTWSRGVDRYVHSATPHSRYVDSLLASEKGGQNSTEGSNIGFEDGVNYWSDYLKTRLHPRSCFSLQGVHHEVTALECFEVGKAIATSSLLEDSYNNLRLFVEECDSFGGLSVITNADNAYAGISANYLSYIQDELGSSTSVLVFGVHDVNRACTKPASHSFVNEYDKRREKLWSQNEAKLVSTCMEFSAEYIPLSSQPVQRIPLLHTKQQDLFHSSAVLGLAIDVALIPLQQNLSLAGLLSALRPAPFAFFGGLASNFPSPEEKLIYDSNIIQTPGSISFSNVWDERNFREPSKKSTGTRTSPSSCTEVVAARGIDSLLPVFSSVKCPVTIPIPFPNIFDPSLERNKYALVERASAVANSGCVAVEQIGILAGLTSVSAHAHFGLTGLGDSIKPSNQKSRAQSAAHSTGVEESELREVAEALRSRGEDYLSV